MAAVRVLIVDDVVRVRQDLRTVLTLAGDIEIVGEAGDGLAAIRQAQALRPDVVLLDLEMPVLDGCEAARQIKAVCPPCRLIALTVHDYETARERAFQAGMDDFVVKGAPVENLVQAIRQSKE
jgi:DNA-binding NarL/FixJ family response regulator